MTTKVKKTLKSKKTASSSRVSSTASGKKATASRTRGAAGTDTRTKRASPSSSSTKVSPSKSIKKKTSARVSSGKKGNTGGQGKGRYAADVEKGPSAWSKEWSGFVSNIQMKDTGATVKLAASQDLALDSSANFSYLFQSAAEKKKVREEKKKTAAAEESSKRSSKKKIVEPPKSKMVRAVEEARKKGIMVPEGGDLNRKRRRELLRLTKNKEVVEAEVTEKPKAHELMDPKQAWYQQGPYPLDVVSEKLIAKKAEKKAKQLGLKYNYLRPHPSWLSARARRRKEAALVALGDHLRFDSSEEE